MLLGLLGLSSCIPDHSELPSYRYRLTVEVDTPAGIRRGSSVIEVRTWQAGSDTWPNPGATKTRENGEAVSIDLGRGRWVFALLRAGNFMAWPGSVARSLVPPGKGDPQHDRRAEIASVKAVRGIRNAPRTFSSGSAELQNWPDLVRFADRSRPETIAWIDPTPRVNGTGIAVRRVTIEIVDASVTRQITRRLPWLQDPAAEAQLPAELDRGDQDPFIPPLSALDFTRSVQR